jgi:hypothetical protein
MARRATAAEDQAEDPLPVVVLTVAMVADPTTLATARFTVLKATANTAESSADTVLTASSDPVAPPMASALDQDLVVSIDSEESVVDSAIELEDVQLSQVAESVVSMSELVVVLLDFVVLVLSALVLVVLLELVLLLPAVPLLVLLDSVVEALLSVPMAVDVVSELVSMVASVLVPLAQVPSEQALEASLELELEPLP